MEQEIKSAGEFLRNVFLTKWKKKNCMQMNISMKQKQITDIENRFVVVKQGNGWGRKGLEV